MHCTTQNSTLDFCYLQQDIVCCKKRKRAQRCNKITFWSCCQSCDCMKLFVLQIPVPSVPTFQPTNTIPQRLEAIQKYIWELQYPLVTLVYLVQYFYVKSINNLNGQASKYPIFYTDVTSVISCIQYFHNRFLIDYMGQPVGYR